MQVRKATRHDVRDIARLYFDTVHAVNSKDYSEAQIKAWAPEIYPDTFWLSRLRQYQVYVVEDEGKILGFAELDRTGYIDCFYVHHKHQGMGVGKQLMQRIIQTAKKHQLHRLRCDVSTTAMLFFKRMGFVCIRLQKKIYRRQIFRQVVMEKHI